MNVYTTEADETDIAVDGNRYSSTTTPAVEAGDILEDGTGNEYQVIIDQTGHAELRKVRSESSADSDSPVLSVEDRQEVKNNGVDS
jgi:hypothetical protein